MIHTNKLIYHSPYLIPCIILISNVPQTWFMHATSMLLLYTMRCVLLKRPSGAQEQIQIYKSKSSIQHNHTTLEAL